VEDRRPPFVRWMQGLARPVEPFGDYFIHLERSVASSAPVCSSCA
jgi:hypothetical protein